jgi:hypothetical protein
MKHDKLLKVLEDLKEAILFKKNSNTQPMGFYIFNIKELHAPH